MPVPAPLHGIRVVDFGHQIAGPLTAVMLADQGADVIRVDAPGAPAADSPADAFLSRNKRRITLNLKDPADLAVARDLVSRSDVLIENFRPGVIDRLGLGYEAVSQANPGLVYASLPGFAASDPRAAVPGWEGVIDAATGNCYVRVGEEPAGWDFSRPTYPAVPGASTVAAYLASVAVVSALTERHRSGLGQRLEVPLYDAIFEIIGAAGAYVTARGLSPQRPLAQHGSGTYKCSDGRYVQFNPIGATTRFVSWFLRAAGNPEWALPAEDGLLHERLTELFATRTAPEWEQLGHEVGVPLAWIRTPSEWLQAAHARAAGEVACLEDPKLGRTWMAGYPVHAGTPDSPDGLDRPVRPRHLPDADRAEILAELRAGTTTATGGVRQAAASAQADRRRPMTGLRVVDLTQILAGPSSARILGEMGADVVKVNAPQRRVSAHGVVNRGKKTILLDVQSPGGQEVFWRLVEDADVVVQNFPPGTAERYGIGYEDVRLRKPGIVYVSVSCYGSVGPWTHGRGYETQGQAVSGVMSIAGGESEGRKPAVLGPYNFLDYGTGVLAAFAATLGIYQRAVTGNSGYLSASLAQTGTYYQASFLLDYDGKEWTGPTGPQALGEGPLQHFYQGSDGWFFLGATQADLAALSEVTEFDLSALHENGELVELLAERFATRPATVWVDALQTAGLGAHEVLELGSLMRDPRAQARELSVTQISHEVGEVTMPGITIRMSATPPQLGPAVHQPGSDAKEVLEMVGLGQDIDRLAENWAVQTAGLPAGWSAEG